MRFILRLLKRFKLLRLNCGTSGEVPHNSTARRYEPLKAAAGRAAPAVHLYVMLTGISPPVAALVESDVPLRRFTSGHHFLQAGLRKTILDCPHAASERRASHLIGTAIGKVFVVAGLLQPLGDDCMRVAREYNK
jgi:hypothetical protein